MKIIDKINQAISKGYKTIILQPSAFEQWSVNRFNTYPDKETDVPYVASFADGKQVTFIRTKDIIEGEIYVSKGEIKTVNT